MPAVDNFSSNPTNGQHGPITRSTLVVPHDTNELAEVTRALHCNFSGTVALYMVGDSVAVSKVVIAGITYPWRVKRVLAAGTTATVVAEY